MSQIKFIPQRRCKSVVEAHLREHNLNQLRKGDKKLTASFVAIDDCNDSLDKKSSTILNREKHDGSERILEESESTKNCER